MNSPCKNCNERWVNENSRCHSVCIKYKDFNNILNKLKEKENKITQSKANFVISKIRAMKKPMNSIVFKKNCTGGF